MKSYTLLILLVLAAALQGCYYNTIPPVQVELAYPDAIGEYKLVDTSSDQDDCYTVGSSDDSALISEYDGREMCADSTTLRYEDDANHMVIVNLQTITEGNDVHDAYIGAYATPATVGDAGLMRLGQAELFWQTTEVDFVFTQEASIIPTEYGNSYDYMIATGENAVTQWFLERYPPR